MINAHLSGGAEVMCCSFRTDQGLEIARENVKTAEEAENRMYIHNRNFLVKKLTGWLKQREFGMKYVQNPDAEHAAFMVCQLKYHQFASYRALIKMLVANKRSLEKCVPSGKSNHVVHYNNEIKPIMDFLFGK